MRQCLLALAAVVCALVGWCQAADHLAMYDADITGVQFFELPSNEAALSGGCVFDGTTGYFGGSTQVYVADVTDGSAMLEGTMPLPASVLAVSDIEGPPPFTTPVSVNGTSTVSFCSETGSFGGGLARLRTAVNHTSVAWVNESQWVYFQGCIGDESTGVVYLLDGGSGAGEGMNLRFVGPLSHVLSFQLPLPVHTFIPGGKSVTVLSAMDTVGKRLFITGVLGPESGTSTEATQEWLYDWQWGITIVDTEAYGVVTTVLVAPAASSTSTVNSIQHIAVGEKYLYVAIVVCPGSTPHGLFCSSQATTTVEVQAYPLARLRALQPSASDDDIGSNVVDGAPLRGADRRALAAGNGAGNVPIFSETNSSIPAPGVASFDCPNAFPGVMIWLDESEGHMYVRCGDSASGYTLLRASLEDLSSTGSTCGSFIPNGFGLMYTSHYMPSGVFYLGLTSQQGSNYIARVSPGAMEFKTSCAKFYQQWWFFAGVIGGALLITGAVTLCVWLCRRRRRRRAQHAATRAGDPSKHGYLPPKFAASPRGVASRSPRYAGARGVYAASPRVARASPQLPRRQGSGRGYRVY